jgi:NADPH-dependent 2,4-dienoyl-CoA reductase/sulfur reductase-like enzyme
MSERIVIVGGSLAGLRAAEALRHLGHDGPVMVVGAEAHMPYDRPPLSKQVLSSKVTPDATALPVDDTLDIEWVLGTEATGLLLPAHRLVLEDGSELPFDGLVIATGARPRQLRSLPPGPGVHYLRTIDDAVALRDDLARSERAAVIGAGFIGLEVAATAHEMGVDVTVLEALPVPLERAIGAEMGRRIAEWSRGKGIDMKLSVSVESLLVAADGRPEGIQLADDSVIAADTVVVGIGVAPTTGWLDGSGLDVSDGVECNSRLQVLAGGEPVPGMVAAGDVARWHHPRYGHSVRIEHWTNAAEQGEAAARTLLRGEKADPYAPTPYFWSDQHGRKLQFVGRAEPGDTVMMVDGSPEEDRFLAVYGRDDRTVAAMGMRRPARVMALQAKIAEGAPFPPEPDT